MLLAHDVVQMMSTIAAPDVKYLIDHLQFVPIPGRFPGKIATYSRDVPRYVRQHA